MKETIRHDVERVRGLNDPRRKPTDIGAPLIPLVRVPAERPYERRGGELRVGLHQVIKSPNWGCASIPYTYVLRIEGVAVKTFTGEPTEEQCDEAERRWRAERAEIARGAEALVSPPRKRGRPRKT